MILTVIFAIIVFSLIIFVHELGHFLTARMFGVKVHEFAIGMGPVIYSKQKGDTKYSVRIFPMGGFCSMEGEDCESEDEGSFSAKPRYAKLVVLAAGAAMNVILGFIICLVFVTSTSVGHGVASVTVDSVLEQSPAADFLQPGDRVVAINGERVNIKRDIDFLMSRNGNKEFEITVKRNGEKLSKTLKPYETAYTDGTPAYIIGFTAAIESANPVNILKEAFFQTIWMGKLVFVSLGMLIGGQASVTEVSGPVGVVSAMNTTAQSGGLIGLLYLASFITVNIGIMNLLPIPALDGGRIFFVLIEAIRRKPIPPEKEGMVHFIGLILLMGIMVFATWNDIMRLITGG